MEFWSGSLLENIASQFGRVLKIDEHTLNLSCSKYACICVELDLDFRSKKGLGWSMGTKFVFITALYEKLLVFCYKYGRVGHRETNCTFFNSRK